MEALFLSQCGFGSSFKGRAIDLSALWWNGEGKNSDSRFAISY
jgi:hypothetical protein